ncbi:MAG: hypothetical protein EBE86_030645 [Hormoscilla sp. GUM202]|nr:hypothetical protein [Hormoscilla sp. GUM202]
MISASYVVKFSEATNAAPTDLNLDNNSINENSVANTVVGTFSTTDPDTGDTFTYQLVAGTGDADNAAFTIVGDQLQINSSPDFETKSSYSIRVQTTDAGGLSYSENFTININDVNEASTITGTSQNDILRGTASGETIQGLAGNDRLYGNGSNDTVEGGNGNDLLYGRNGDDLLDGGAKKDRLYGGEGKDTLLGGDGHDILYGNNGDDLLDGGAGSDRLYGHAGNDTLDGGAGSDRLYGHAGSDTFVLAPGMGRDTIYNFEDGTDKIGLGGGLSFSDLEIVGSGSFTRIKILDTGETLATLRGIDEALIVRMILFRLVSWPAVGFNPPVTRQSPGFEAPSGLKLTGMHHCRLASWPAVGWGRTGSRLPILPFETGLATFIAGGYWVIGPCHG